MPAGDRPAWLWPIVLVFVVLPAAVGFWVFVVPVYRAYRMRLAGAKAEAGEACPACGNEDFEPIGPEVFRCKKCGMVSGDGVVARRRQLRKESIQRTPPGERIAAAESALREARLILVSAQSLLNDAAARSKWDIAGLSMDRGQAKQSSFGAAVRDLRNAEELANDALELLDSARLGEPLELDTSPVLLGMDTAWLTDGVIPNVAIHLRIEEARKRASRMLERVEALLASVATLPRPRRAP
jgi:ribosomal protein L37AE/L43A